MLAARSQRTASHRGYPFVFERHCGVLGCEIPNAVGQHIHRRSHLRPLCFRCGSFCHIRLTSCSGTMCIHRALQTPDSELRKEGFPRAPSCNPRGSDPLGQRWPYLRLPYSFDLISSASIFSLMFCKIFAVLANILGWSNLDIGHTGSLVPGIGMTSLPEPTPAPERSI
jgi:hypothetical protein